MEDEVTRCARVAYAAYAIDASRFPYGQCMPAWDGLASDARDHWKAAARAVVDEVAVIMCAASADTSLGY